MREGIRERHQIQKALAHNPRLVSTTVLQKLGFSAMVKKIQLPACPPEGGYQIRYTSANFESTPLSLTFWCMVLHFLPLL
ncbi:hypothetical protein NC652_006878 [Populus alba x Populus x berolinensis]|nr:hypothetical protein NC652_006878 [Populus alba x Populus x berolinensis]